MKADIYGKGIFILCMTASLILGPGPVAFGAPPFDNIPEGLTEESYERLYDDTVEWGEIGDLIKYRSPVYTDLLDQIDTTTTDLEGAIGTDIMNMQEQFTEADEVLDGLYQSQKDVESRLPEGSLEREQALKQLGTAIEMAKAGKKQLSDAIGSLEDMDAQLDGRLYVKGGGVPSRESLERQLYPVAEQLSSVIEGLMISYGQLELSRDILAEQVSLYERLLSVQTQLLSQGLATAAEVEAASLELETARSELSKAEASLLQLATAIGLQLGYSQSEPPHIGELPVPDTAYVEAADLEKDLLQAANENSEVKAARTSDGSSAGDLKRDRNENAVMGKLSSQLSELYADMKQKKLIYDGSAATLQKAQLSRTSAETRYSMGMLSEAEYKAQLLTAFSYEASARLAELNLLQAINNYKWAVNGVMTLG